MTSLTSHVLPRVLPRALRTLAVLIAVAAVVDPDVTSLRSERPLIAIGTEDSTRDAATRASIRRALEPRAVVLDAPFADAATTIHIGRHVPAWSDQVSSPVIVVPSGEASAAGESTVVLERVSAPATATLGARVTVTASMALRTPSASDVETDVDVALAVGPRVVSRTRARVTGDSVRDVSLAFVPTVAEPTEVKLRVSRAGSADTLVSDLLVDVGTGRRSVLFFDRRPSWTSTFARRALERDPRFAVTSRVVTSTNVSRETGRAPASLDAIAATDAFDAVVIGAPEALTARDVAGLETLLRVRGLSVVLLPDHAAAGPVDALTGMGGWRVTTRRSPARVVATEASGAADAALDSLALRVSAPGTPARLPVNARVLGVLEDSAANAAGREPSPVVWYTPTGLGRLFVSGAFDAWRYRDPAQSRFDATMRDLVEFAAAARVAPLELELSRALVTPRTWLTITLTPRDTLSSVTPQLAWRRSGTASATSSAHALAIVRRGTAFLTTTRAPVDTGRYELLAVLGPDTTRHALVVAPTVARAAGDERSLLAAWAAAMGGRVLDADQLPSLPALVDSLAQPLPQRVPWHPMRSPWWILPFALALSAEWWLRRRRGDR